MAGDECAQKQGAGRDPTEEEFGSVNWSSPGVCVQVGHTAVGFRRGGDGSHMTRSVPLDLAAV